jgi:TonB family protein
LYTTVLMNAAILIVLLALISPLASHADGALKDALKKQYQNRVLFLRSAYQEGDQEFDSAGKPTKGPAPKKWTTYEPIWVTKLEVERDRLLLRGPRVAFGNSEKLHTRISVPIEKEVKVVIHLDHPLNSVDEASGLLEQVFAIDEKTAEHPLPEYRRPGGGLGPDDKIYHVSTTREKDKASPPMPIYVPDPEFSDDARRAKYQGDVTLKLLLDKKGTVSRITIIRGLGLGLDEKSVERLKTWRFKPALLNGEPVFVEVSTEVSFRLY